MRITGIPTWELGFENAHMTVYWRATAKGNVDGTTGLTDPIADYTIPVESVNFIIRSHIDLVMNNFWVVDTRDYLIEKVLPLDIPWHHKVSFVEKGWNADLLAS